MHPSPLSGCELAIDVDCFTDDPGRNVGQHEITLRRDWSVATPHDLDAEEVAVAMGGLVSCVDLVRTVVPAVQVYLGRQLRRLPPTMRRAEGGRWAPLPTLTCCAPLRGSAQDAARHVRGVGHVSIEFDTWGRNFLLLAQAVLTAHGLDEQSGPPTAFYDVVGACVRTRAEVQTLWNCGLSAEAITRVHFEISRGKPLGVPNYLSALAVEPEPIRPSSPQGDGP